MEQKPDKKVINFENKKWIKFDFGNEEIQIKPFISLQENIELMGNYVKTLFKDNSDFTANYISAEFSLILGVVDACTNILVITENNDFDVEGLINSGLWSEIKSKIVNYAEFESKLKRLVDMLQTNNISKKSIGENFDRLCNVVVEFIGTVSKIDISENGIKQLLKDFQSESGKFLSPVVDQSEDVVKKTRKPRTQK